jgi:hypothetical protein
MIEMGQRKVDIVRQVERNWKDGIETAHGSRFSLPSKASLTMTTNLRCCNRCLHRLPIESAPLSSGMDSTSSPRLRNSSLRRWKRTSTLLTAKEMSFKENRHGLDKR